MPRKRTARRGRKKRSASRSRGRVALWGAVVVLAVATAVVGGYLVRSLPERDGVRGGAAATREKGVREQLEELIGPLDDSGMRVRVDSSRRALELSTEVARVVSAQQEEGVRLRPWTQTSLALLGGVTIRGQTIPLRIEWGPAGKREDRALLVVVIDDMGRNLGLEQKFLELPLPITPSLLPYLRHTRDVIALSRERGTEYLLHLPMQPRGYPGQNPGKGAILEEMNETQVREGVRALLNAVPGAAGANNHMGSRLTSLSRPMGWVLEELRAEGLYFLDSMTSADSVGSTLARELGVGWARRDIFIDNVREVKAVGAQLDKAIRLARRRGQAIAIGHPHRATLEALEAWGPKIKAAGVQVVPLGALIRYGDGA